MRDLWLILLPKSPSTLLVHFYLAWERWWLCKLEILWQFLSLPSLRAICMTDSCVDGLAQCRACMNGEALDLVTFRAVLFILSPSFASAFLFSKWGLAQLQTHLNVSNCFELGRISEIVVSSALPLAPSAVICYPQCFTLDLPIIAALRKRIDALLPSCCFAFCTFKHPRFSSKYCPEQPRNQFPTSLQRSFSKDRDRDTTLNIICRH